MEIYFENALQKGSQSQTKLALVKQSLLGLEFRE